MSRSLNERIRAAYIAQRSSPYTNYTLSDENLTPAEPRVGVYGAIYTVAEEMERRIAALESEVRP